MNEPRGDPDPDPDPDRTDLVHPDPLTAALIAVAAGRLGDDQVTPQMVESADQQSDDPAGNVASRSTEVDVDEDLLAEKINEWARAVRAGRTPRMGALEEHRKEGSGTWRNDLQARQ